MEKLWKSVLTGLSVCILASSTVFGQTTTWTHIGSNGKLVYTPNSKGDILPDYSYCGYKNGDEDIPNAPVVKTISPVSGNNLTNIQNAINEVQNRTPDANGIRGAILLRAGEYRVSGTLRITRSGVILRGEGNGTTGTRIVEYATSQIDLLAVSGSGGPSETSGTRQKISDSYVGVGARSFTVPNGAAYKPGDLVTVLFAPRQAWIDVLGTGQYGWTPSQYNMNFRRKVTAVSGNRVTIDVPLVQQIDSRYADGYIYKYSWANKTENVGVENLRIISTYNGDSDEAHGWRAITFSNTQNAWVTNVICQYFGYSLVSIGGSGMNISVLNCQMLDPKSRTEGGRKYSFDVNGQLNLVKNCYTRGGRHDYVTGAQTCGPNAFVSCRADQQHADIGPHHRWGCGALFDNVIGNFEQNAQQRADYGTGHGWAGAQTMFWNCTAPKFIVQSPPQHMNWAIGCKGNVTQAGYKHNGSPGIWQSTGTFVTPQSIYEQQLKDRKSNTPPAVQEPYGGTARNIPGRIEAEDYDLGGEGLAYHETTAGNSGSSYRTDNVDIQAATEGGFNIGWTAADEWLEYSVKVTTAGRYDLSVRVAANAAGRTMRVEMDGQSISGTIAVPNTTDYQNFQTVTIPNVNLSAGDKIMRVYFETGSVNLNYISFAASAPACEPVSDSGNDGNVAANVLDGNLNTRWSASGDGQWIQFCLGEAKDVSGIQIAFYNGNVRSSVFDIQVSNDGQQWNNAALAVRSSGTSTALENFNITPVNTKYIRLVGHGNSVNAWNSYTEVKITIGTTPPDPTNVAPTVSLTAPASGAVYTAPASVIVSADAADSDGTVSKVDFYYGTTLIGSDATAPYSITWNNVAAGNYTVTARAMDDDGAVAVSSSVSIVVNPAPNAAPTASITSPANNAGFNAPASITINANAADSDGTISKVDFYNGTTLIGTDAASPYSFTWANVVAGTYSITVRATDNRGAVTTSTTITVRVNAVTNPCSGVAQYTENSGYVAGSIVQNGGSRYQCKPYPYSGWCNGSAWAYAPGTGSYWADAWTRLGSCSARTDNSEESASTTMISPNPAKEIVHIEVADFSTVVFVNTFGEEVLTEEISSGTDINISELTSGVYLVKIISGGTQTTQRLIVQ